MSCQTSLVDATHVVPRHQGGDIGREHRLGSLPLVSDLGVIRRLLLLLVK